MDIKTRLKAFYKQFISLKGEPKPVAMGMAMGIFIGVTPTIPFHTLLIIVLGILFRQNITSACLGSWLISNPFTIPLFYVVEYRIGKLLIDHGPMHIAFADYTIWNITEMGSHIILPLLAGGMIIAPLFAIPAYFITHRIVTTIRTKHRP